MTSDPVLEGREQDFADPADEAGCAAFERTLLLMDGLLDAEGAAGARAHADSCALCGPMVREWAAVSAPLAAHLESVAEGAKPELARMPDRVLAAIDAAHPKKSREEAPAGFLHSLLETFRRVQAPVALAVAVSAIALVLSPLLNAGRTELAGSEVKPNDVVVREISFDGGDGMVYRTRKGGMTVIWINEYEGA